MVSIDKMDAVRVSAQCVKHGAMQKFLLFHSICILVSSVLFIFLFHTPIFADAVLFYRGIAFIVFVACFLLCILLICKKRPIGRWYTYRDIALGVVLFFSVNLIIFTHLPVTVDRSISLFLLGYMNNHPSQTLTVNQFNTIFIDKYVYANGATQKRFTEQLVTGTVVKAGNGYKISPMGSVLIRFFAFIADLFGISRKNLSM